MPKQVITLYFGGIAVRVMIDSGAQKSFIRQDLAEQIVVALGIHIRKLEHPLRLRLAEGKLSDTVLTSALRGAKLSALNGEVHETIDQLICLPTMPPGCDMIGGRDLIFHVLRVT